MIASGEWQVGSQIPTVEELAAEYGVARATVRQALGILNGEGLIERYRAKGTFVTYRPQEQLWCEVETDWSGLLRSRSGATIELLSEETGHQPPNIIQSDGERARSYRRFRRRHWREGKPFLLADTYLDEALCKRISHEDLVTKTALSLVADIRGLKIAGASQTLTIGAADVLTAKGLQVPLNVPVAYVHRTVISDSGRLVMVSDGTYRGDVVRLDIKLK
ncbi:GntR-family transcriptional regulator [Sphingobium indicum UT26S]|uniref:GntR-family transcriptional regulator n=2 Tax=Sphingomonadaceae TaxID=41297 RepID=D4YXH9_SPHIU|nr:GntR family transcriptional regulator [Sphingobium sp. HDIP04]NYI24093.1 GntR family transcriptional regulator [Sphingobium indicum]BAI95061.1 GntR-family transcriptional regulator [Sphingobium indicum UT26S]